jgi:hypothetical protein
MTYFYKQFFSFDLVDKYTSMGLTADGTKGGLLLGPSHADGGINVLIKYAEGYRVMANFEGQEYLLNPGASQHFSGRLHDLNQHDIDLLLRPEQPSDLTGITTIDCFTDNTHFLKSKFLLIDARGDHFIINKYSTWRHLYTFEQLNKAVGFRYWGTPLKWEDMEDKDPFAIPNNNPAPLKDKPTKTSFLKRLADLFR